MRTLVLNDSRFLLLFLLLNFAPLLFSLGDYPSQHSEVFILEIVIELELSLEFSRVELDRLGRPIAIRVELGPEARGITSNGDIMASLSCAEFFQVEL